VIVAQTMVMPMTAVEAIVMVASMIVHGHAVDRDLGDHRGGDHDRAHENLLA
jgi:hypothetical protein